MDELAETVAVITGAASGLGLALAHKCAARDMSVVLLDLDQERAVDEAGQLASVGATSVGIGVDVGDAESVQAAADAVAGRFGRADLVISNVGVQLFGAVERLTDPEWAWVLDLNVIGSARVARAFLPLLRRSADPHLAFTTSSSVLDPAARLGVYQASKYAVWGLAETLRLELAAEGIPVSMIMPSGMLTRHLETSEGAQPDSIRRPIAADDDLAAMMASNADMTTTLATPDEAADGVIEAILAGDRYIITHGDLTAAIEDRYTELRRAAQAARA
jgi:NAD(P)-dependent dehydrogenase (short-subunit alcohol dehydrogenase family)